MAGWHARDLTNGAGVVRFPNVIATAVLLMAAGGLTAGCALPPGTLEPMPGASRVGQGSISERDTGALLSRLQSSLEPIGTLRGLYGATALIRVNGTDADSIPGGVRIVAVTVSDEAPYSDRIVVDLTTVRDGQP